MRQPRPLLASSPSSLKAIALGCAAALATITGCGGSNGADIFQAAPEDAGSLGTGVDASLYPTDAGSFLVDATPAPCPPAPATSFKPTWKPPLASKSGACNQTQISSYFDACLGPTSNTAGCTAFCTGECHVLRLCLQTDEDTRPRVRPGHLARKTGSPLHHEHRRVHRGRASRRGNGRVWRRVPGSRSMQGERVQRLPERDEPELRRLRDVREPGGHRVPELHQYAQEHVRHCARGSEQPGCALHPPFDGYGGGSILAARPRLLRAVSDPSPQSVGSIALRSSPSSRQLWHPVLGEPSRSASRMIRSSASGMAGLTWRGGWAERASRAS